MSETITIAAIGAGGYWAGETRQIAPEAGCPQGWTRALLPPLAEGEFAVFEAPAWIVTSDPWTPPAASTPPVPQVVTRRQAKLALLDAGVLDAAEAAIAAGDAEAKINWNDALEFRRDNPLVLAIGAALSLDAAAIDDLFRQAATKD